MRFFRKYKKLIILAFLGIGAYLVYKNWDKLKEQPMVKKLCDMLGMNKETATIDTATETELVDDLTNTTK